MREAKRSFQAFVESEEASEAENYQQQKGAGVSDHQIICRVSTSIDSSTKEGSDSSDQSSLSSTPSSSSDLMEDASSFSSSSSSNGPLYQLSDLMAQLPIKRGLSKYYQGKSQSFASLANVEKLEDLAKRENPYRKRIKLSKNSSGCFDTQKFCSPKATISKKTSYSSRCCFSSSALGRNTSSNLMSSCGLHDF